MSPYKIDRSLLEAHSSAEIRRILREEREDYTPEAIKILEEILESRGDALGNRVSAMMAHATDVPLDGEEQLIHSPTDARRVLDHILKGVLSGSVDPQVGHAASSIVMAMLRAMELEYVSEIEEEGCASPSCRG